MNWSKMRMILALLAGLAATVAVLCLLSSSSTQAATSTIDSTAHSGPGDLLPTASRSSASSLPVCDTDDIAYPLPIPLHIRDTFGPRLLKPSGYSRYDYHHGIDLPADEGTPVRAVAGGTVRAVRNDWRAGDLGFSVLLSLGGKGESRLSGGRSSQAVTAILCALRAFGYRLRCLAGGQSPSTSRVAQCRRRTVLAGAYFG